MKTKLRDQRPAVTITVLVLATAVSAVQAQSLSLEWWTIDGGGGTSSGGVYSLTGTVGQPDAGAMSGGAFSLLGGFWPAPSGDERPSLSIQRSGDSVIISWSSAVTGFELETTEDLDALAWTAAPAGNPVMIPLTGTERFYRLRRR